MVNYIYLTILFPLAGFIINGLYGRKIKNEKIIGWIGAGSVGLSFLVSLAAFFQMLGMSPEKRTIIVNTFNWINSGTLHIDFGFLVDPLSIIMSLIVTGVGFLIHVYSIGYMHGDKGYWRFFAYLNLFIFAMMNLVLGDNFVLLFLGWEGVGLCSYLLIGFWYDRKFEKGTVAQAAKKAFIVNRIGDFGFLLGLFLIFMTFDSLNFTAVFSKINFMQVPESTFSLIALFLFIGATGKSAQIPLFIWLPDAMAGPTPVSALIHAATMVTAGVYMVSRTALIFVSAPVIMTLVAVIGLLTAFFAATVGLVQNDIKKILAYSTVSQLGYMFLAAGVGAFSASIFHVMTHAFFKALLFLGAGSIIHSMHEEQNIQKFGNLKKYMPMTYVTFLIGAFAISGFPGLSGFFSKDEILWNAYTEGNIVFWLIGVITAMMTAFYMFRLVSLTFFGKERFSGEIHPHESPAVMTTPLAILAVFSIIAGYIGIPELFSGKGGNKFEEFLKPVYENAVKKSEIAGPHGHIEEVLLMVISVILAVGAIYAAYIIFTRRKEIADKTAVKMKPVYNLLLNKYYVDEIYEAVIIKPIKLFSEKFLWKITDNRIIDGTVNGAGLIIQKTSSVIRKMQTGITQFYAFIMVLGIAIILSWIIFSM